MISRITIRDIYYRHTDSTSLVGENNFQNNAAIIYVLNMYSIALNIGIRLIYQGQLFWVEMVYAKESLLLWVERV